MRLRITLAGVLALCVITAARADEPSAAEHLLFSAPHLSALQPPTELVYQFDETEPGKPAISDSVRMRLQRDTQGGCCAVTGQFLTGPRTMGLPDIDNARANPVLLYFLEYEVRRLARSTGGNANHFRRRIREALVNAMVTPTRQTWQGREVAASEVVISPFLTDPFRDRFSGQANTRYRFVIAESLPGHMLLLSATLPGDGTDTPPRRVSQITLQPSGAQTSSRKSPP